MKPRLITFWDSGWRGGGLCTPTQLCSGLRSTPYVKTFRMSVQLSLILLSVLMTSRFLPQHSLTKSKDGYCLQKCSDTAFTPMFLKKVGAPSLAITSRRWSIISRDVAAAAAHLRYLETVRNFLRKVFLLGWNKFRDKAVATGLFSPVFW